MSPFRAPGRRVSPWGEAPPRSSGRGQTWQRGAAGALVLARGTEQAARPGRRLRLARLKVGKEKGDEGAAVGGSDLRAEVSTRKLRSEVHRLEKVKTQPGWSRLACVSHAARRVGAWSWLLCAAAHKSAGGAAGREDAGGPRLGPALCPGENPVGRDGSSEDSWLGRGRPWSYGAPRRVLRLVPGRKGLCLEP